MKKTMSEMVRETKGLIAKAFDELRRAGYVCRSAFMCCGTCAGYAISQMPKYHGKAVFFHRQDDEQLRETNSTYLGWEGKGEEIAEAMKKAGLTVEWDGDACHRILVTGPEPAVEKDTLDLEDDAEKRGPRPRVKLLGEDGNAFAILGRCSRAARAAGKPQPWIDRFMTEAKAGNYDHLLQTTMRYFEVV